MSEVHCPAAVIVSFEEREDGRVRAFSRNLRGLHLSGDRDDVWGRIPAAIQFIVERNFGGLVRRVTPAQSIEEAFSGEPFEVSVRVEHEQAVFLVEYDLAA